MKWTEEQQEVIDTRNKNILVSAAAGSGKTAVLTERILQLVTDENHPVDIDKLVVVTFTKAAAGEMRERILKALQKTSDDYLKKVNEGVEKEKNLERYLYMQRQLSYIYNARITTIDSFCLDVVRENFAGLEIDPSFRIGEEGELTLLRADVMAQLLERYYEEGTREFLDFVDVYASSRSDDNIEEMILTMYRFAMSYPYPEEWVEQCAAIYVCEDNEFEGSDWYLALKKQLDEQLKLILQDINCCISITQEPDGPWAYESAFLSDKVFVEAAFGAENYEERQRIFAGYHAEALSRKKQPEAEEWKKDYVKSVRDDYKKLLKNIAEKYFTASKEEVLEDLHMVKENAAVISRLTVDFIREYAAAKREKNLVDFSDLEHFALQLLVERDADGTAHPSSIACSMAEEIEEIMVDEYQDSNYVQEMILTAISGKESGRNNLFMVGDVKQSIYKFRMAKPELFLEKYNRFSRKGEGNDRKIILSKNFRSRKTILDVANEVFRKIMTKELGGIVYDDANALYYGASYEGEDAPVELFVMDTSKEEGEPLEELADDVNAGELEAEYVALRIRKLYEEGFLVTDKTDGSRRKMKYSDVAVLLRSMGEYAQCYERAFKSQGIPVRCPVKKGCFDSYEVNNILEFLSIIDNPRQDIPLTAVLENMFRFTDEEVAKMKIYGKMDTMYDNVLAILDMEELPEELEETAEKLQNFRKLLKKYRKEKTYLTIYDLINHILEDTGFEYFILAFPDGTARMTNIAMLKERAAVYQQGSYSGLFHFIRYIEKNQQYEIEQEMMSGAGEEDAVTIMSIHKSKGLEYPVTVVGALGKKFNNQDAVQKIVLHQTYGIGMDRYNKDRSIKSSTLVKRAVSAQIVSENMAEELRVLYVAMTRAKEKLILAGNGKLKNKWAKYERLAESAKDSSFHINQLLSAGSFLDLLLMSMVEGEKHEGRPDKGYCICVKTAEDLAGSLVEVRHEERKQQENLSHWDSGHIYNEEIRKTVQSSLSYEYPYRGDMGLKAKVSISDIKHKFMKQYDEEEEQAVELAGFQEEEIVPAFLQETGGEKVLSGANRGTAYHRVFELLDYGREFPNYQSVDSFLQELQEKQFITEEMRKCIYIKDILAFLQSSVGKRMKTAYKNGTLHREQQFVMGIPARELDTDYQGGETLLVQGIIDAYFEEDGKMCVVDYKTDFVESLNELDLRYHMQLQYYGTAVEQITGKKLHECIIYSVRFGQELKVLEND